MQYRVYLNTSPDSPAVTVDLTESAQGTLAASVGGRPVTLDFVDIADQLSVTVDGKVVDLKAFSQPPDLFIATGDFRGNARVEGDRFRSPRQAPRRPRQPKTFCAPMPGRVVRVAVQMGDTVVGGQTLVVLEAMKMENEVLAPQPGTVLEVHVSPGTAVDANAKLVTLSGAGDSDGG